jgi:hypothetical protein
MGDRDQRYRQQRDRYRTALVEVAAVAVVGEVTAALDCLPIEPGLRAEVEHRARELAREVDRLASLGA